MANNNGHWYTDKNGHHYFVEDGQNPKEGWEASKQRKMISEGKYQVSDDGNEYREVDRDEYDKYEADESEFDENNDDDFGFDEYNEEDDVVQEMKENGVDMDSQAEIREYLGATLGWDREDQMEFVRNLGFTPFEEESGDDEDEEELSDADRKQYVDKIMDDISKASDKNAFEYVSSNIDDLAKAGLISELDAGMLSDMLYEKEMERAQNENADMSENEPEEEEPQEDMSQEEWNDADAAKADEMKKQIIDKHGAAEGGRIISNLNKNKNDAKKKDESERPAPHSMRDYVYDEQNPVDYPDKKHRPTPNQRKAAMADRAEQARNDEVKSKLKQFGYTDEQLANMSKEDLDIARDFFARFNNPKPRG